MIASVGASAHHIGTTDGSVEIQNAPILSLGVKKEKKEKDKKEKDKNEKERKEHERKEKEKKGKRKAG